MNKLKKGFTLIELLAVIVILAVIALITVPIVLGVIDDAKEKSFKESLRFVIDATNNFVAFNPDDSIPKEGIPVMDERIKMNNKSFKTGMAFINKDNEVELDFVSNGEYCGAGTKNNIIIVKGSCNKLDKTAPVINLVNALAKSSSEIEVTVSALDPESGIKEYYYSLNNGNYVKVNSNKFSIKNLDSNKEYKIKVKVINGNNLETISEEVSVKTVELVMPTFTLDKEGWQKQRKVTINYNKGDILKYSYSLDNGVTWIEVTNNPVITLTENKVIIAKISDSSNFLTNTYQETQIDNNVPTLVFDDEATLIVGQTFDDMKNIKCVDSENTCIITVSGTVNIGTLGTYTLTYTGTDEAGNVASKNRKISVITMPVYGYGYTGTATEFIAPYSGNYRFELYGAKGGGPAGGNGAYTKGDINLVVGEKLYIYIGGTPGYVTGYCDTTNPNYSFNGSRNGSCVGGGGATDVRLVNGEWDNVVGLRSRIMVAAGGGGHYATYDNPGWPCYGGGGGALSGYSGNGGGVGAVLGIPGSQTSGAAFGSGGYGTSVGGGGYYGGGGGFAANAAGGSSFISGYPGCNAVNESGSHTNQPKHYSNKVFTNSSMTAAVQNGYGYARVSIISIN